MLEEVRKLTGAEDYAFPGRSDGKRPHLTSTNKALQRIRARTKLPTWTVHDFRTTFRTHATRAEKPQAQGRPCRARRRAARRRRGARPQGSLARLRSVYGRARTLPARREARGAGAVGRVRGGSGGGGIMTERSDVIAALGREIAEHDHAPDLALAFAHRRGRGMRCSAKQSTELWSPGCGSTTTRGSSPRFVEVTISR